MPFVDAEIAGKEFGLVTDTERANALRGAICQIWSATGKYAHDIPRLCQEAVERDNDCLDKLEHQPEPKLGELDLDAIRLRLADHREALRNEERMLMHASWYDVEALLAEVARHRRQLAYRHQAEVAVGTLQTALRQLVETWRQSAQEAWTSTYPLPGCSQVWQDCADEVDALLPALEPTK